MKVRDIFHLPQVDGDLGVEIEVEGRNLPRRAEGWRKEADGSLRGESAEFVLSSPSSLTETEKALNNLKKAFKESKSDFFHSYRAGVHVHVNVQELTGIQLGSMITAYYLFENSLVHTCDKSRRGNHFCLRGVDAPMGVHILSGAFASKDLKVFNRDNLRYSSINVTSLPKYGSVEFRSMESTDDFDKILTFSRRHLALRKFAQSVDKPTDVISLAQEVGPRALANRVFGEDGKDILNYAEFYHDFEEGLEHAEDIAFCTKWGQKSLDIFRREANYW